MFVDFFFTLNQNTKITIYILLDLATFIGYNVVSRPFLNPNSEFSSNSHSQRLENYYQSGRMLVKLAEALGRISLAGRELTRLAGFTERVMQLLTVLDELIIGKYQRTMVESKTIKSKGKINDDNDLRLTSSLKPNCGKIIYKDNLIRCKFRYFIF